MLPRLSKKIKYDVDGIEPLIVCGLLIKALGLEAELESYPESTIQKEIKLIGNAISRAVYNSTAVHSI